MLAGPPTGCAGEDQPGGGNLLAIAVRPRDRPCNQMRRWSGHLADESLREQALSGDVDGDGRADRAYLVVDPAEAFGCRAFLVVETDLGPKVTSIRPKDERAAVRLGRLPERFPEFGSAVFASCPLGRSQGNN